MYLVKTSFDDQRLDVSYFALTAAKLNACMKKILVSWIEENKLVPNREEITRIVAL